MEQEKVALVLGATGGIGGDMARRLVRGGWQVVALTRDPLKAPRLDGVAWRRGDAMVRADVVAAARGVSLIVHAVNPPGYRDWDTLVLPMLDNTIAAAGASGARIVLPGTIYNYGSGTGPRLAEDTPQRPSSRKGAIRVRMEERLRQAAAHGVRSLVVRAGDFFGPRSGNTWFAQAMVKPGQPPARIVYPGAAGVGHAWAYLPDLADTMVRLLEQEARLAPFDTFHFRGHWDGDGMRMVGAIRRACGRDDLPLRRMPWAWMLLLSPFVTFLREVREVRYLWQQPFELDNAKLVAFLGGETHTPLDAAVSTAMGMALPEQSGVGVGIA